MGGGSGPNLGGGGGVVSHGHHRQMGGLRMGRSGESGWVSGLMIDVGVENLG